MLIKQKVCSYYLERKVVKVDPCGVCGEWIGCNFIQCMKCQRWVHQCCSDVLRQVRLPSCWDVFIYRTCFGRNYLVEKLEFKRGEDVLEEVEKFCYLGGMISVMMKHLRQ